MIRPQLTLGLPVYNGENFLREAIESLLAQTFTDFELVICDNCSIDSTPDMCRYYANRDPRVSFHQNDTNLGAAANYNKVVELAHGQYFAWVNHDDLWAENCFERCVSRLNYHPSAVLAYARAMMINHHGEEVIPLLDGLELDGPRPHQRLRRFHDLLAKKGELTTIIEGLWTPIYGVIRTETLKRTGLIGPYISSDTILLEELLMHGEFVEVEEPLFRKRDHPNRSMREYRSYEKRIEWFSGDLASNLALPLWRLLFERILATGRSRVRWRDKVACYAEQIAVNVGTRTCARALAKEAWLNTLSIFTRQPATARMQQTL